MKKILKMLIIFGLLGILFVGMIACENTTDNNDDIVDSEIYSVYVAYAENGGTLTYDAWLASIKGEKGDRGVGIASIINTGSEGLVDSYTITFTDGTTKEYTITNGAQGPQGEQGIQGKKGEKGDAGNGIVSMEKTSSTCYKDVYTITFSDNSTTTIEVDNNGSGHIYGEWSVMMEPTCTIYGLRVRLCNVCGKSDFDVIEKLPHTWDDWTIVTEPTCTETGEKTRSCSACGKIESDILPATGHVDSNADNVCDVCGITLQTGGTVYTRVDENGEADAMGDYLYFGSYPQSEVTDSDTKSALKALAGELPEAGEESKGDWTSYGYYIEGSVTNFMWYIDLGYNGEKYRGVYFTSYRPYYTTYSSSTDNSYQDNNGYNTSTVYWFKYEPIKWRILSEENGEALILCEMIIDSHEYYINSNSHDGGYANNYVNSTIRAWLNDTFYNTAFSDLQKEIIQLTTVDNSARSTNPNNNATKWNSGNNTYACANTEDYIFLLSEQEVTNSTYGFNADYSNYDTVRRKKTTAYAKCQGMYTETSNVYLGNGWWWLRSPFFSYSDCARGVGHDGYAVSYGDVYGTSNGVVPALVIRLS